MKYWHDLVGELWGMEGVGRMGMGMGWDVAYNEGDFESQPRAVRNHPSPRDIMQPNWIHKRGEEAGGAAGELEERYAFCALGEGKELD
jgi:hypothetical protein